MTIQVNVGEAKTRLSELLAAVERGEEVIIARDGTPRARLAPIDPGEQRQALVAKRRAFCGSLRGRIGDLDWSEPSFTDAELDSFERPF